MTVITKTNERDERKQIGDALTGIESDITTLQSSLAALQAQIDAGLNGSPPIELNGIPTTKAVTTFDTAELEWIAETTASETVYDTWKTVLEETAAAGVIEFMIVYQVANASDRDVQARLTVDGTVVWLSSTTFWTVTGDNSEGVALVGCYVGPAGSARITFGSCPFTTSFKLDFKKTENAAGTVEMGTRCRYYLTG